ncbi:MAG: short subunit dehydrogenase-like uncharacterized protein [Cognaticolwellia sp.]|jgi:short subunit dehydrogenase-like uncharacterized protein
MKTLFYGITGYTGELILEEAKRRQFQPIIAGRNEEKLKVLAERFGLAYRVFDLEDMAVLDMQLSDIDLVLHCAGPFHFTAAPMIAACLRNYVHYLDLSGRVEGFEEAYRLDEKAVKQQVMLMPGVGFDVVPSDCLVAHLHQQLPDATHLTLAIAMKNGGVSHGTALSTVENLPNGATVRRNGKVIRVPLGEKTRTFKFGNWYESLCATAPWGDVSTAYYTANIPNVEAYLATTAQGAKMMRLTQKLKWLLKQSFIKNLAKKIIDNRPPGLNEAERSKSESYFYAEVRNEKGEQKSASLRVDDAYENTAQVAVHIVKKIVSGNYKIGFQTPGGLYGSGLILEIEGSILK